MYFRDGAMPDNFYLALRHHQQGHLDEAARLYRGLLAALFPRAKFIHCRRDVAVSCWMTNFRHIRWANDPDHIEGRFEEYRRLMEHWRRVLPVPLLEVDYEETVADLEGQKGSGRPQGQGTSAASHRIRPTLASSPNLSRPQGFTASGSPRLPHHNEQASVLGAPTATTRKRPPPALTSAR
jgi:hypothetical protein